MLLLVVCTEQGCGERQSQTEVRQLSPEKVKHLGTLWHCHVLNVNSSVGITGKLYFSEPEFFLSGTSFFKLRAYGRCWVNSKTRVTEVCVPGLSDSKWTWRIRAKSSFQWLYGWYEINIIDWIGKIPLIYLSDGKQISRVNIFLLVHYFVLKGP